MNQPPQRFIYFFGSGQAEGGSEVKHLVGGKGASLADMTRAGLNVPPGFTISAVCCEQFFQAGRTWPPGLDSELRSNLERLQELAGRPFGRGDNPLLVAVRSGAAQSMPGMMDTVLNVGLNPECVRAMAERTGNPRGAWEAYRHFLAMFGRTVGGVPETVFTQLLAEQLQDAGKQREEDLDAGQMEKLCQKLADAYRQHTGHALPTEPYPMLCAAINAVFDSWNSERAITYRRHHNITGLLGTAVNVQMMCPSEVSGVMFTANPVNPGRPEILIEASYGLGEAIVLGKVTPDRFVVDKPTQKVREKSMGGKETVIATLTQAAGGPARSRDALSLSDPQVEELARLGLRVEEYFKFPCDLEWALSGGQFYLLQARPIKGLKDTQAEDAEREQVRQEEIAALRARAAPGGTIWSRYNLSEILPEPTPMSWAIVRRLMSGRGGYGLMYRDLGFSPDASLDEEGCFDLICGRPYCNLSREPLFQYRNLPFDHPFAALKANPSKAIYPSAVVNPNRVGWRFFVSLPILFWRGFRSQLRLSKQRRTLASRMREELLPAWLEETTKGAEEDLSSLEPSALVERLEHWILRTLHAFARESLKPTVVAALLLANLKTFLYKSLGAEKAEEVIPALTVGARPDAEADLPAAIRNLGLGRLDRSAFLERFGHRGSQEMELAQPRWSEDPTELDRLAAQAGNDEEPTTHVGPEKAIEQVAAAVNLTAAQRAFLETEVRELHTFLGLRETAKHYLMRGYALIRRILVELDRRYHLEGGIFFLTPEELPALISGTDLSALIVQRRRRRMLALDLEVPQVIFSDDLEVIGRPLPIAGADTMQGVPLSAGVAEAPALVLNEAAGVTPPSEPYILVCPSTDPAWVPLFVHARALVMETGGVLSHGAIVAREFGLPAVAGLPDVHRRLHSGQRLRVDGATGTVMILPG
jgi:pyruvate,water dikinase